MSNSQLLHVSDFHAHEEWFNWLIDVAPRFGLVAFTGDLLDLNSHRPLGEQVDRVLALMRKVKTPTAICSGNHDSLANAGPRLLQAAWLREVSSSSLWTDLNEFDFAGFHFRCIPWQGTLPQPQAREIWLHHAPPSGFKTAFTQSGADFGDWALGEACRLGEGPRVVLGGHVHDPVQHWVRAGKTWSLNPGYAAGAKTPSHHILDLNRGIAQYLDGSTGDADIIRF